MRALLILLIAIGSPFYTLAQEVPAKNKDAFRSTNYPLPRFVSLGADKVYVRTGPGSHYPVKWTFKKKALPVEIILEFEHWRKIRDIDGDTGWIHLSLLSGKRTAIITSESNTPIYKSPNKNSAKKSLIQPKSLAYVSECETAWCDINVNGYKGWIEKKHLWGVYENEKFD